MITVQMMKLIIVEAKGMNDKVNKTLLLPAWENL